jgi:hypothetical protein
MLAGEVACSLHDASVQHSCCRNRPTTACNSPRRQYAAPNRQWLLSLVHQVHTACPAAAGTSRAILECYYSHMLVHNMSALVGWLLSCRSAPCLSKARLVPCRSPPSSTALPPMPPPPPGPPLVHSPSLQVRGTPSANMFLGMRSLLRQLVG